MLHIDLPTPTEFKSLLMHRSDACISIYVETTPLSQDASAGRIALKNHAREAREQLEAGGADKRRVADLVAHLDDIHDDDEFWRFQAHSLAVLATPDSVRTFRLANRLTPTVQVSDRFHLKPLLRAISFPHAAHVLAISENAARLVEVHAELPAETLRVPDLPKDAASAVGKSTLNDPTHSRRVHGLEGQNLRFLQYARKVDAALRPVLKGDSRPLILAGTGRVPHVFRQANSYAHLLAEGIDDNADNWTDSQVAEAARPILDKAYAAEIDAFHALFGRRASEGRASTELSSVSRAATFGAVEAMLVDMDKVVPGVVDADTGEVLLAEGDRMDTYGVLDEIAGRAFASGAKVLAVRRDDLPEGADIAAILRYPV